MSKRKKGIKSSVPEWERKNKKERKKKQYGDGLDDTPELVGLNLGHPLGPLNFKLGHRPPVLELGRPPLGQDVQLRLMLEILGLRVEQRQAHGRLSLDDQLVRPRLCLSDSSTARFDGSVLGHSLQQMFAGLLHRRLVSELLDIKSTEGLLVLVQRLMLCAGLDGLG